MATPEKKVKTKIKAMLDAFHVFHFSPATHGYGKSGVPDIIGCCKGRFFAIECKAGPHFSVTDLQAKCMKEIGAVDGKVWLVTDQNVGGFKEEFYRWANEQD